MTNRKGTEAPSTASAPASDDPHYVRLHITPLDAELLKIALSSTLLPKARNISFHSLETFPEKRFGFLDLPEEDATKISKKLNGSVLKGVKIRIERARPSSLPTPLGPVAMTKEDIPGSTVDAVLPPKDKKKKRKRGAEELSGIILEEDRKIKRGWTNPDEPKEKRSKKDKEKAGKEKKKRTKSKYTDHAECLVKTVLPAIATPLPDVHQSTPTTKKKKGKSREVVIHEFEKTTKFPTFLKAVAPSGQPTTPLEFVDGKGWVNEDGEVIEPVQARPPPSGKILLPSKPKTEAQETKTEDEGTTSSSDEESDEESEMKSPGAAEDSEPSPDLARLNGSPLPGKPDQSRPRSSGSTRSLSIKIPPATPSESRVHPLEALYKRDKQADGEIPKADTNGQSFSFFGGVHDESDGEEANVDADEAPGAQVPLTPYTRHDLELRGIRSAAPTPDTAHPKRRFTPWEGDNDGEEQDGKGTDEEIEDHDEEIAPSSPAAQGGEGDGKPASDFQDWFWKNRGDLNRSWKKRRKAAGKEKRYRENKARMARAI
ncbi:hypothetical protein CHGG_08725 [Chaetomium globosum CBS 148.51]|uniref:Uncharacterized protein n=1 Tax=Chaetomium globosum (strain ATCC 6205 / CBS 148.51 / DSM 1962 / NBRC 6347 / NRRL 1970) TaxID=306901 RepID=Q2GTH9_CHAGB|nr:uncharacterized protein CHGG_08725 [Chaetomium globosum CBS 148.51]EAQ84711.1 hypothetical protein CHGG_08725 [Chaetomium globosum CBS 148.51]